MVGSLASHAGAQSPSRARQAGGRPADNAPPASRLSRRREGSRSGQPAPLRFRLYLPETYRPTSPLAPS